MCSKISWSFCVNKKKQELNFRLMYIHNNFCWARTNESNNESYNESNKHKNFLEVRPCNILEIVVSCSRLNFRNAVKDDVLYAQFEVGEQGLIIEI